MYKPLFNHVLVEVDDKEAAWGKGNNENLGGEAYREGKVMAVGTMVLTADYPLNPSKAAENLVADAVLDLINKQVMWNEGHEAGKTFEEDGKKYALVYWWDLVGVKDEG